LQSLPTHLTLLVLFVSAFANTSAAADLKWRSGRIAMSKTLPPAKTIAEQQFMRPRVPKHHDEASTNPQTTAHAENAIRKSPSNKSNRTTAAERWATADEIFQRQATPQSKSPSENEDWRRDGSDAPKVDPTVKPAAFEEEGPQLTGGDEGQARLRSIVVDREEELDFTRSAQLPATGTEAGERNDQAQAPPNNQSELDTQLEQDLRLPFGAPNGQDRQTAPPNGAQQQPFDTLPGTFPPTTLPDGEVLAPLTAETSDASCRESLDRLRAKTIDTVNISIAVSGEEGVHFPYECSLDDNQWHEGRSWEQTTFLWKASALCHKPLYFEDPQLERYGHSFPPCCQPLISGAHFFTRLPILPYCMGVEPPTECIYSLGHYRPGSCAPYMFEPIPISYRGALFQAGAVVGTAAALP
jgi:hypothetical protein